eukprot:1196217-Prorocentrum_minimum.AAC.1
MVQSVGHSPRQHVGVQSVAQSVVQSVVQSVGHYLRQHVGVQRVERSLRAHRLHDLREAIVTSGINKVQCYAGCTLSM